jgi:hypothetical protein
MTSLSTVQMLLSPIGTWQVNVESQYISHTSILARLTRSTQHPSEQYMSILLNLLRKTWLLDTAGYLRNFVIADISVLAESDGRGRSLETCKHSTSYPLLAFVNT